jgi:hypothetical protein
MREAASSLAASCEATASASVNTVTIRSRFSSNAASEAQATNAGHGAVNSPIRRN